MSGVRSCYFLKCNTIHVYQNGKHSHCYQRPTASATGVPRKPCFMFYFNLNVAVASRIIFYDMVLFLEQIVDCGMLHDARSLV